MTLNCIAGLRQAQILRGAGAFFLHSRGEFASRPQKKTADRETGGKLDREASTRIGSDPRDDPHGRDRLVPILGRER
jgi:hypothetical protein